MRTDFYIRLDAYDNWLVLSQEGFPLLTFRRRHIAEAYGKALAHRAGASLVVHRNGDRSIRYSGQDLTYPMPV